MVFSDMLFFMKQIQFYQKKIGIWGFGVVGKSALRFFRRQKALCSVLDQKESKDSDFSQFLDSNEYILPSPGIDLRPYEQYQHKFLAEADIFRQFWHKPIIGITGSVGKTTVTTLLAQIMEEAGYRVAVGGNIGIGMLDLIADQDSYDYAILELSSFQLALCRSFAPDLAIWTNFYPNHLDRHGSVEDYFEAKMNILQRQKEGQLGLVGESMLKELNRVPRYNPYGITRDERKKKMCKISNLSESSHTIDAPLRENLFKIHPEWPAKQVVSRDHYKLTHPTNWQTIIQALEILNIPIPDLSKINFKLPEHRLEKVATINGVTFYNDSKATIAEATLAAVEQFHPPSHDKCFGVIQSNIILLLGGLSKGVNRKPLILALRDRVKHIIAFGDEADDIAKLCNQEALKCISCTTLEAALENAIKKAKLGDQILLSPGGASFDLFSDYVERGAYFKKLINKYL